MERVIDGRHTSPIRRLTESGRHWRVLVETWPEAEGFRGRLLFRRDAVAETGGAREGATVLQGASRGDVLALAHDLTEAQLRRVLHSLG